MGKIIGILGLSAFVSFWGCGGSSSDSTTTAATSTDLSLTGELGVTDAETSLRLSEGDVFALEGYDLFCVTFEATPQTATITIDSDGNFTGDLTDFAGSSFGCFLRQNNSTIAALQFDDGSGSLATGAGALKITIRYDAQSGSAVAVIDTANSSALSSASGGTPTTIADVTGTWTITCLNDDNFPCEAGDGEDSEVPESVFLQQFQAGETTKVAIWGAKASSDICLSQTDSTPGSPKFFLNFRDTVYPVQIDTKANLESTIDSIYSALPSDLKSKILKVAKDQVAGMNRCENNITIDSCKFIQSTINEEKFVDRQGVVRTKFRPKEYSVSDFNSLSDYTGTVSSQSQSCRFGPPTEDNLDDNGFAPPPCPPFATDNGDGSGSFDFYLGDESNPILLLCTVPGDSNRLMHHQGAEDKSTAFSRAFSSNPECESISDANSPYNGLRGSERDAIRRAVLDLTNLPEARPGQDASSICSSFTPPTSFTACADFEEGGDNGEIGFFCGPVNGMIQFMGLQIDQSSGKLAVNSSVSNPGIDFGQAKTICPTTHENSNPGQQNFDFNQFSRDCRTEFVALSLSEQLQLFMGNSTRFLPAGISIMCGESSGSQLRQDLASAIENSCLPQVFYDWGCDERNNCGLQMRCPGSSAADGSCFDSDGVYAGRIAGRFAVMKVQLGINDAFTLHDQTIDIWYKYDHENQKAQKCVESRTEKMDGLKISDDQFDAIFTSKEKRCDSQEGESNAPKTFKARFTKQ